MTLFWQENLVGIVCIIIGIIAEVAKRHPRGQKFLNDKVGPDYLSDIKVMFFGWPIMAAGAILCLPAAWYGDAIVLGIMFGVFYFVVKKMQLAKKSNPKSRVKPEGGIAAAHTNDKSDHKKKDDASTEVEKDKSGSVSPEVAAVAAGVSVGHSADKSDHEKEDDGLQEADEEVLESEDDDSSDVVDEPKREQSEPINEVSSVESKNDDSTDSDSMSDPDK